MPTKVTSRDVTVSGDKVIVAGEAGKALVKSLVQKNTETMAEISSALGFVHPKDITIEADGSVHIDNAAAAQKVQTMSAGPMSPHDSFWDTNCSCK